MTVRNARTKKGALFSCVAALMFVPISVGPLESAGDAADTPLIAVAGACAQGFGCAWWPEFTPRCPNLPPPWYCNFGDCDPS